MEMRYREKEGKWCRGRTENISRSGVLFRAQQPVPENTQIELRVRMPWELTGKGAAEVFCHGRVVRVVVPVQGDSPLALAASIRDYRFLKNDNGAAD
jgi:hypothetical protein